MFVCSVLTSLGRAKIIDFSILLKANIVAKVLDLLKAQANKGTKSQSWFGFTLFASPVSLVAACLSGGGLRLFIPVPVGSAEHDV